MTCRPSDDHVVATQSPAQTRRLGRRLARLLLPGDLICLRGELGAGKTTLIQGIAAGLGAAQPATSPSFTLLHHHPGRVPLYHLDLYRLGPGDLGDIGLEELIGGEAVVAVEWSERLPPALCREALLVEMDFGEAGPRSRRIRFRAGGERGQRVLAALLEEKNAPTEH